MEKSDSEELKEGYHRNHEEIREIKTIIMGPEPARSNGMRGDLLHLKEKVNKISERLENLWNHERKKQCYGLEECAEIEKRVVTLEKHIGDKGVAETNLKGVYFLGFMTLAGQIFTILKDIFTRVP